MSNVIKVTSMREDGQRAAGTIRTPGGERVCIWERGLVTVLPDGADGFSRAWDPQLSADGVRLVARLPVAGVSRHAEWTEQGGWRAFGASMPVYPLLSDGRWVLGTRTFSGQLPPVLESVAGGALVLTAPPTLQHVRGAWLTEGAGSVVGWGYEHEHQRAWRWTMATGFELLATPHFALGVTARAASQDGRTVVGASTGRPYTEFWRDHAVRWCDGAWRVIMPGNYVNLLVSADGGVVVGSTMEPNREGAPMIWFPQIGAVDLEGYLRGQGLNLERWQLDRVVDISADGRVLAGVGRFEGVTRSWIISGVEPFVARGRVLSLTGTDKLDTPDWFVPTRVSRDGRVVLGLRQADSGAAYDFYAAVEEAGVRTTIRPLPGDTSLWTAGMSADGRVVVGISSSSGAGSAGARSERAFMWTRAGGTVELARPEPWRSARALGVSADGRTIVGSLSSDPTWEKAVKWVDGAGPIFLDRAVFALARATATSADGAVTAGRQANDWYRPGVWRGGSDMTTLVPALAMVNGECVAVSDNGTVVAGMIRDAQNYDRAVRWVGGVAEMLPLPAGMLYSQISGMTGDGEVMLGSSAAGFDSSSTNVSFIWTRALGVALLERILRMQGYDVRYWSAGAWSISEDRRTLLGYARAAYGVSGSFVLRDFVIPCGWSDVAGAGQVERSDGALSADDLVVYVGWFFAGDARADVGGAGGAVEPDGVLTVDDLTLFVARFFAGC